MKKCRTPLTLGTHHEAVFSVASQLAVSQPTHPVAGRVTCRLM